MALSAGAMLVAGTGSVRVAPVATVAPVDVASAWGAGWLELGYTTPDGVTFTDEKTIEDIMSWQSFNPTRKVVTARNSTATFSLQQWDEINIPFAFGGGAIITTAGPPIHYRYDPPATGTIDERAMGIELVDGSKIYRIIIPRGIVTESVEANFTKSQEARLPITFGVLGTDGTSPWYIRTNDTSWAA